MLWLFQGFDPGPAMGSAYHPWYPVNKRSSVLRNHRYSPHPPRRAVKKMKKILCLNTRAMFREEGKKDPPTRFGGARFCDCLKRLVPERSIKITQNAYRNPNQSHNMD